MKHIILTGGGTAGHVTPNIALLPRLRAAGYDISYIGSREGIEKKLMESQKIPYYGISSGKLRRYFDWKNFTDPFRVLKGFSEASSLMKRLKPDLVFSKGGFVSVPVVMAAKRRHIPVICHPVAFFFHQPLNLPGFFGIKLFHTFHIPLVFHLSQIDILDGIAHVEWHLRRILILLHTQKLFLLIIHVSVLLHFVNLVYAEGRFWCFQKSDYDDYNSPNVGFQGNFSTIIKSIYSLSPHFKKKL